MHRPPSPIRLLRAVVLGTTLGVNTGCYTTRPLMGSPAPGAQAVALLNDRGRLALGDSLGSNVDRLTGDVVARGDTTFVLAVRRVRYLGGQENAWNGERVTVPVGALRGIEERRFSRVRSYLLAGAIAAAVIVFVVTRSILGDDGALVEPPGGGPPPAGS